MPERFKDPRVEEVFKSYPAKIRSDLMVLRQLIFETARKTESVGDIIETLKWNQPSYLPRRPRTGTTLRIAPVKKCADIFALYFPCQTNLAQRFEEYYPEMFRFEGNRALLFPVGKRLPRRALKHCIAIALTYHLRRVAK